MIEILTPAPDRCLDHNGQPLCAEPGTIVTQAVLVDFESDVTCPTCRALLELSNPKGT